MAKTLKMKRSAPRRARTPQATCPSKSSAPSWMLVAAFVVLLLLALALFYQYFLAARIPEGFKSKGKTESFDGPSESKDSKDSSKGSKLVFLYMNGCGWCEKFKPQWDTFSSTYAASLATNKIELGYYERNDERAKQYDGHAKGYPTVLLVKSDKVTVFEGDRTPEGLVAFLNENGFTVKV